MPCNIKRSLTKITVTHCVVLIVIQVKILQHSRL